MLFYTYYIQGFLCMHFFTKNEKFNLKEPFQGLFTQGMVCHETYKDKKNIFDSQLITIDGKKFLKENKTQQVKLH